MISAELARDLIAAGTAIGAGAVLKSVVDWLLHRSAERATIAQVTAGITTSIMAELRAELTDTRAELARTRAELMDAHRELSDLRAALALARTEMSSRRTIRRTLRRSTGDPSPR